MAVATSTVSARPGPRTDPTGEPRDEAFGYRPALDGIRALSVLAVIAYHDNYGWAEGGFLGVDTFFVLSGFLITTLLVLEYRRHGTVRLAEFWTRRARRLLPALFLVLCFVAAYTQLVVSPWERTGIRKDALASLFYVTNWRFLFDGQSYFELFSAASPLRHMWSLAIEEQFYLLWPLIVLACLSVAKGSTRLLGLVCGVGVAASIVSMAVRYTPDDPSAAYYATDARAHTLLIGALLALLLVTWRPSPLVRKRIGTLSVLAFAAVLVAWHGASGSSASTYRGGLAVFAVLSAALIAGAMQPGPVATALAFKPLVWIGRISYGLYLWHWPVNLWLVPSRVSLGPNALNGLRLAVTFAAAIASYHFVERPIRERRFRPRAALSAFAPAAAVVAAIVWLSASGATPPPSYLAGVAPPAASAGPGKTFESASPGMAAVPDGPTPQFPWGYGDPLLCGEPRANETEEAVDAARAAGDSLSAAAGQERVLLIGDSTACSLWPGLRAVGEVEGVATDQGSVFGCGVATGEITSTRNEAITPHSDRCRAFLDYAIPPALARARPTVIVWMSIWEKSDLVIDGRTIVADTPEWETAIMAAMDDALRRLTADGARVVMVTQAAPAPNPAQGTETFDREADDAGYVRLNALLERFAARHPDRVTVVDVAARLCPDGPPCPKDIEGMTPRPDGRHFTPTAAAWAARILFTEMFAGT